MGINTLQNNPVSYPAAKKARTEYYTFTEKSNNLVLEIIDGTLKDPVEIETRKRALLKSLNSGTPEFIKHENTLTEFINIAKLTQVDSIASNRTAKSEITNFLEHSHNHIVKSSGSSKSDEDHKVKESFKKIVKVFADNNDPSSLIKFCDSVRELDLLTSETIRAYQEVNIPNQDKRQWFALRKAKQELEEELKKENRINFEEHYLNTYLEIYHIWLGLPPKKDANEAELAELKKLETALQFYGNKLPDDIGKLHENILTQESCNKAKDALKSSGTPTIPAGYHLEDVDGDGNCFYRAIYQAVIRSNTEELREAKDALNRISEDEFVGLLRHQASQNVEKYYNDNETYQVALEEQGEKNCQYNIIQVKNTIGKNGMWAGAHGDIAVAIVQKFLREEGVTIDQRKVELPLDVLVRGQSYEGKYEGKLAVYRESDHYKALVKNESTAS
tara:strand:+ start:6096 stop:7433 length:1338 start_codon:yes stop_codon:yes gene_type:complete